MAKIPALLTGDLYQCQYPQTLKKLLTIISSS